MGNAHRADRLRERPGHAGRRTEAGPAGHVCADARAGEGAGRRRHARGHLLRFQPAQPARVRYAGKPLWLRVGAHPQRPRRRGGRPVATVVASGAGERSAETGAGRRRTAGGDKTQASLAASLLRPMLNDASEPEIYSPYARANEAAGDSVRAGEAFADASYYSGRPFDAMEQLKRLLKRGDLDYYARARIQARITELTPLLLELRKRKIQTQDNPDGRQQLEPGGRCAGPLCFGAGAAPVDAWRANG